MEFYFFWKHRFGQWTMRDMSIDGATYCCCEQWMMAEKARLFEDWFVLGQIMASNDPRKIKSLGREVKNFDKEKWEAVAVSIVIKGNLAKFTQHEDLKELLLSTKDKILAEASPYDPIWGIGLSEQDPRAMDMSQWQGKNLLGNALMVVRSLIVNGSAEEQWKEFFQESKKPPM